MKDRQKIELIQKILRDYFEYDDGMDAKTILFVIDVVLNHEDPETKK